MTSASRLSISLLAVVFAALLTPALATASGTYQVVACNDALNGANNSWVWATTDPSQPPHYAEHERCPYLIGESGGPVDQASGLSTTDALGLHNGSPPGSSAAWTLTAPPGTTIAALTYERYIGHELDSNNYWVPALRIDGNIAPGETCLDTVSNDEGCFVGGPPGHGGPTATITGLSAHQLSLGIDCQAPSGEECITGATLYATWAATYGTIITLNDPTPPTITTPTGPLWEPTTTGYRKGTESLTTTAADAGGGVQSITLSSDGQPIETYTAPCDYTRLQPCPLATGPQTITLPTTQLPDGTHTLTVTATDAAGNQSTPISEQVTIDNTPPPPPTNLTATPTQPGSSTFTLSWNDPSHAAPITSATYQVCPVAGPPACTTPATAPPSGPITITLPGPGRWTAAVWLTDATGNTSPTNAAYTTLIVPSPTVGGGGGGGGGSSTTGTAGNNSTAGNTDNGGQQTAKPILRLRLRLRGRELVVNVTGPQTGKVHVSFTARYHRRLVASGSRTLHLKHGRLTTIFKLSPHDATHASIRVGAKMVRSSSSTTVQSCLKC